MKTIYEKINPDIPCAALYKTFTRKVYAIEMKYREKNKTLPYDSIIFSILLVIFTFLYNI